MTPERMKEIRIAARILSSVSDSEWEEILVVKSKKNNGSDSKISNSVEEKINERITNVIIGLGIPAHIRGYRYFKEAIFIYMTTQNPEKLSVTKQIYPVIAKKFETTSSRVERALRHAIEVAWSRGDIDIQNEIFGYTIDPKKGHPTNSEAIATIADYLKRN